MKKLNVKSRTTITTWIQAGKLPEPMKIGKNLYWYTTIIAPYIDDILSECSIDNVLSIIPINSRKTLLNLVKKGEFPKPSMRGNRYYWKQNEIYGWLKNKDAA